MHTSGDGLIDRLLRKKSRASSNKFKLFAHLPRQNNKSPSFSFSGNHSLRILTLPKEVILLIEEGKISQGHAKILVGLQNAHLIAKKIINKKLSVRQSENLVRLYKSSKKIKLISKDPNMKFLEDSLNDKLGIRTYIKNKKNNSGIIYFEYKDLDQLNRLIEIIKKNY